MAHDVFISHAHKDKRFVVAICKKLECAQLKCWIAERDISAGEDWTEATRNAIASSRVMVLVLSENGNAAPHIEREIAHAFYTKRPILPVRLTDTPPRRDFLFYLGHVRWFDAFTSPLEQNLEELASSIHRIVHGHTISPDIKLPHRMVDEVRKASQYSDSWMGALRASHYGSLEILKRISIGASILTAIWVSWFVYSQMKPADSPPDADRQMIYSARGTASNLRTEGTADSPGTKPTYSYTRLGLWVPSSAGQKAVDDKEGSVVRDDTSVKSVPQDSPGIAERAATMAAEPSPAQTNEPASGKTEPENPEDTNQSRADLALLAPSVAPSAEPTPLEAQGGRSLKGSAEEQSLKELVLEYLRTVATDDASAQERLLAGRVDFYGKGVLSFPEIEASMELYRRKWPIRKWEPKGEPEFPNTLHSSDPDQYEVLQPFDWTVANGSKQKQGSANLYLRIRKAENGAFHIFHLEQRHL